LQYRDFNADGWPEVVGRVAATRQWLLYPAEQGPSGVRLAPGDAIPVGGNPPSADYSANNNLANARDFYRDGIPDLFGVDAAGRLNLCTGTGLGKVAGIGTLTACKQIGHSFDTSMVLVGPGDWDGNGTPDLIMKHQNGNLYFYPGNGNGDWDYGSGNMARVIGTSWQPYDQIMGVGDWDGDGRNDIVARNGPTGQLLLFRGSGSLNSGNGFGPVSVIGNSWQPYDKIAAAGDFDRNGRPDIIARCGASCNPAYALYLFPNQIFAGGGSPVRIGTDWGAFSDIVAPFN